MNIGAMISAATGGAGGAGADVVDDCPVINGNNSIAQRYIFVPIYLVHT